MSTIVSGNSGGTAVTTTTLPTLQGQVLQVVHYTTGAVATGTTTIPLDDTIPQNTEGSEFMTLAITPHSATSKLLISVVIETTTSVPAWSLVGLFQDSTANALASMGSYNGDATGDGGPTCFNHYMTSGTTSSTTFKVRAGPAVAATMTVNGQAGARQLGGTMASSITITEVVP